MSRRLNYGMRGEPLTPAEAKAAGVKISAADMVYAIAIGLADPPDNTPILSIATHPTNQTASNGSAAFSIVAATTDGSPITYQWQKQEGGAGGFSDISGETSDTLSLTAQTYLNENGDVFRCVVAAAGETLTSNSVTLTVPQPAITITSQPSSQTASAGAATFSVSATVTQNATPITYQWQKQESGAGAFSNVSGATSSDLVLSGLTRSADNGDVYRCVVGAADGAANVTSSSATLTVYAAPNAPTSLSATAGDAELALSWTAPTDNGGQSITGYRVEYTPAGGSASTVDTNSTSTSYTLTSLTNDTLYTVRVAAINSVGLGAYSTAVMETPTGGGGGGAAPILLATFDIPRVVDSGPNNYWLSFGESWYTGGNNVGSYYQNGMPVEPYISSPGKYSTYAVYTGDDNGAWSSFGVRIHYSDPAGLQCGQEHLISQLESQSWTMEAWLKPTASLSLQNYYQDHYFQCGPIVLGAKAYDQYEEENNGAPAFDHMGLWENYVGGTYFQTAGNAKAVSASTVPINQWSHLALVRDTANDELRVYLNGALVITAVDSTTTPWSWREFEVGHTGAPVMRWDQIRIMPGVIYSGSTITPPAAGFTYSRSTTATTKLLLNATHGMEDWGAHSGQLVSSQGSMNSPSNAPKVSGAAAKWGAASYRFGWDGGAWAAGFPMVPYPLNEMYAAPNQWAPMMMNVIDNGPWTIEAWIRPATTLTYSTDPETYAAGDGEMYLYLDYGTGKLALYDNTISLPINYATPAAIAGGGTTLEWFVQDNVNGGGTSYRVTAPTSLARDQWHHVAVVADTANNLLRLKINGAQIGTIDISSSWATKGGWSPYGLYIGGGGYQGVWPASYYMGYMDDIRISSTALYGTGSYTVPAAPLT